MRLPIVINCTFIGVKRFFFFLNLGFAHSDVCDLLVHFLAETSDKIIKYSISFLSCMQSFVRCL